MKIILTQKYLTNAATKSATYESIQDIKYLGNFNAG